MSDNILTLLVVAALVIVGLIGVASSPSRFEKIPTDLTYSIPKFSSDPR